MLKVISLRALIENVVALILRRKFRLGCIHRLDTSWPGWLILNARIDNYDGLDAPLAESFSQALRIGKSTRVEREHAIFMHVMNVEVDDVKRKIALAVLPHHFFDDRFRIVTVATLLHAQRPKRRHRHMAGQIGIAAKNLFDRWPIEKIVVKFAAFRPKPNAFLRQAAELEIATIAVIKEDSVGQAVLH